MDVELFIKQRGLNPQEKLDNDTGGYWKLKDLLEDFVECQNKGQSLPIDSVSNCDHSNEVQRQGDGFVYTVCGDCGKDLD